MHVNYFIINNLTTNTNNMKRMAHIKTMIMVGEIYAKQLI